MKHIFVIILTALMLIAVLAVYGLLPTSNAEQESSETFPVETPDTTPEVVVVEVVPAETQTPLPAPPTPDPTPNPTPVPSMRLQVTSEDEEAIIVFAKCLYMYETKSFTEKVGLAQVIALHGLTGWRGVRSLIGAAKYHDEFRYENWVQVTDRNKAIATEAICRVRLYLSLINNGMSQREAELVAGMVVPGNARYAWESSSMRLYGAYDYVMHIQIHDEEMGGPSGVDWDWSLPSIYEN